MKIRNLFFLAIITVLLGVVTTCEEEPDSSGTVSVGNTPINVPGGTLTAKLQWLESNAVSNTNYIIEVANDEFINPQSLYFSGRSNITIQLKGIGSEKVIQNNVTTESLFTIRNDVILILDNIILKTTGNNRSYPINIEGGTFIMNGGKISGNRDIGVRINDGTFIMNSGEISGNKSSGVLIISGIFTMNGGKISGNGDSGVCVQNDGTLIMNGGEISGNSGIGVSVSGTFIMTGGEISGNTAYVSGYGYRYGYGGGVYITGYSDYNTN
jgi:hypothetical protein